MEHNNNTGEPQDNLQVHLRQGVQHLQQRHAQWEGAQEQADEQGKKIEDLQHRGEADKKLEHVPEVETLNLWSNATNA